MPVYVDRVKETSTTTGTGTLTLAGAATGFQSFSTALATGSVVTYCIEDGTNWEVGVGTFTTSGTTLSRTQVIASSNSGALVSWSAGSKNVFLTLSARDAGATPSGIVYGQAGTTGCLAATYDRANILQNFTAAGTSGTIRAMSIHLPFGLPVTNISFISGTTAAGTPLNQWFVLLDKALEVLAVTADDTTTAWGTSTQKTLAITSGPFITLYSGLYYIGYMVKATIMPTIEGVAGGSGTGGRGFTPISSGNSSTAQTTPITVGTTATALSAQANFSYAEIS